MIIENYFHKLSETTWWFIETPFFADNKHAPQFSQDLYLWDYVARDNKAQFTVSASDKDSEQCASSAGSADCPCDKVFYSLMDERSGHFSIDPYLGVVHYDGLAKKDFENPYMLTVTAYNKYPDLYDRLDETTAILQVSFMDDYHKVGYSGKKLYNEEENNVLSRDTRDIHHHRSKRVCGHLMANCI